MGREYKYNLKKPYLGLEMGNGIGREAVLGGAVLAYWEGGLYGTVKQKLQYI